MAQVIVRNLDDSIKSELQRRARLHGWSMEEEIRLILGRAVGAEPANAGGLGTRMAARFAGIGLDEPLPEFRGEQPQPMKLDQ